MKKCLLLLLLALSLHSQAQTSYIEIISHLDMTSQFVFLDIGKAASYSISENGERLNSEPVLNVSGISHSVAGSWKLPTPMSSTVLLGLSGVICPLSQNATS